MIAMMAMMARTMPAKSSARDDDELYERVAQILEQARGQVARSVNTAMVQAYWLVGREIVEVDQAGAERASYGDEVIQSLSTRLAATHGKGFSVRNLRNMRQVYLAFPAGSALATIRQTPSARSSRLIQQTPSARSRATPTLSKSPAVSASQDATPPSRVLVSGNPAAEFPQELSWSHYLVLTRVTKETARAFYEIEAARECWSVRQLERQIGSQLFERLANHRDPEEVLVLARRGQEVAKPTDVIKDPFVLEFLDLGEPARLHERDVEQAIIDRLETFLLEMGKGFCFVGRQKRLTVEGDHFYVDLVFYNRLLRCFVLVDLKLGKLTHQDLGQMQMYVNYYDRTQRAEHENKTIGIVLCSEKNAAMVRITLPENNDQIIAATYRRYLPTEAELAAELERERTEAERVLRLTAPAANGVSSEP
jgi:predicted nuclease of restriction endonuclease-like (RecB) superfamily